MLTVLCVTTAFADTHLQAWFVSLTEVEIKAETFTAFIGLKGLDLGEDKLPIERALGVQWCVESDVVNFRIKLKVRPCTRRRILSTISSIYDPLGFIAPVVLSGKTIVQRLSLSARSYMPIADETFAQWERWRSQLFSSAVVPSCFKPPMFLKAGLSPIAQYVRCYRN